MDKSFMTIICTSTNLYSQILVPILIAILSYIVVDRLGEWKSRKRYSKLGIVIIQTLFEEVKNGRNRMEKFLKDFKTAIPTRTIENLPNKSWIGISTISDDVLLRIIEVSKNVSADPYHPKDIKIHCMHYFENICNNVMIEIQHAVKITQSSRKLSDEEYNSFSNVISSHEKNTTNVIRLLNKTISLLDKNSKRIIPK